MYNSPRWQTDIWFGVLYSKTRQYSDNLEVCVNALEERKCNSCTSSSTMQIDSFQIDVLDFQNIMLKIGYQSGNYNLPNLVPVWERPLLLLQMADLVSILRTKAVEVCVCFLWRWKEGKLVLLNTYFYLLIYIKRG